MKNGKPTHNEIVDLMKAADNPYCRRYLRDARELIGKHYREQPSYDELGRAFDLVSGKSLMDSFSITDA